MNYYKVNSELYRLLSKVIHETQVIKVANLPEEPVTRYPRLKESSYVISKDVQRITNSVVTAHDINEYRPSRLRIEKLMRDSDKLLIDRLLEDVGGIRVV